MGRREEPGGRAHDRAFSGQGRSASVQPVREAGGLQTERSRRLCAGPRIHKAQGRGEVRQAQGENCFHRGQEFAGCHERHHRAATP